MRFIIAILLTTGISLAKPLALVLPTPNTALFDGKPEDYYMYTNRTFAGVSSKPWTAGQYGFVRNPLKTKSEGVIATKFHEGLDIKPIKRDRSQNPLDEIRAIAAGKVVYVNNSRAGDYGRYLVIQHDWGYGLFFSLYAHLSQINCTVDQEVAAGDAIAIMGFTGNGINRERSHLHLELGIMASDRFDDWHAQFYGGKSPRGLYNGLNLIGLDIASLLLAEKQNPNITIPQFLSGASPYFKVAVPRGPDLLSITKRYPWLLKGDSSQRSHSWEISFTDSGIPLSVIPSNRKVAKPTVTFVRTTRSKHEYYTRKRLTGTGRRASLTARGQRFIALFTDQAVKKSPPPLTTPQ